MAPWRASYDPALVVSAGDRLDLERQDDRWPGWWWVRNDAGLGGWLPADVLEPRRPGPSRATTDFDTRELTVAEGERLAMLRESRGWAWCRNDRGEEGWVPLDCLDAGVR